MSMPCYENPEDYIILQENRIKDLESQIATLKSQLANIKYLNAGEVEHIIGSIDTNQEKVQAICNLAIPDIDRDKIIEVLREHNYKINEINMTMINYDNWLLDEEQIADEIIKAIRGEE